ncbi:MAG: exosortase/archaeosortase family protein [Candidatus Dormibacteraceae bacterium]
MRSDADRRRPEARSVDRLRAALPAAFLVVAVAVAVLPVVLHALDAWWSDSELSFGFAVPPIAAALAWLRRPRADAGGAGVGGSWLGLLPLGLGLVLLLAGTRIGIHAIAALGVLPAGLGLAWLLGGRVWVRSLSIPLVLLTGALALFRGLLSPLGFALQQASATGAAAIAGTIGLPVTQVGVNLYAPHVHLVVAEACSGMDSLLALLCLGGVVAGLAPGSRWRRGLLLLFVLPVILIANVLRITLVLFLGGSLGALVEEGLGHAALSAILFGTSALLLLALAHLLECPPRLRSLLSPAS